MIGFGSPGGRVGRDSDVIVLMRFPLGRSCGELWTITRTGAGFRGTRSHVDRSRATRSSKIIPRVGGARRVVSTFKSHVVPDDCSEIGNDLCGLVAAPAPRGGNRLQ